MERTFELILPTVDNSGHPIRFDYLDDVVAEVAAHFNGVTVVPTYGCWRERPAEPIKCEKGILVSVTRDQDDQGRPATTDLLNSDSQWLRQLGQKVALDLGQAELWEQELLGRHTIRIKGQRTAEVPPALRQSGPPRPTTFQRLLERHVRET